MNSGHSLEAERDSILGRMQARREGYRRMLHDGLDISSISDVEPSGTHSSHPAHGVHAAGAAYPERSTGAVAPYGAGRDRFPRSTLMRVVTEHPLLCALGVAAVVVIGPKRIARTVMTGGTTVTALAAGNRSNIDLIGRILTMAGAYVQGRTRRR